MTRICSLVVRGTCACVYSGVLIAAVSSQVLPAMVPLLLTACGSGIAHPS